MFLRDVRFPSTSGLTSLRVENGIVTAIDADLSPRENDTVVDGHGSVVIPGLWDQHVHVEQTAAGYSRLDTTGVASTDEMVRLVRESLEARENAPLAATPRPHPGDALVGIGHRLMDLWGHPTVAALDDVSALVPIVLIGGDAHHAWMNSAALRALDLPYRDGIVAEAEWFAALPRLVTLPGVAAGIEQGVELLQRDALRCGVVGLRDFEWTRTFEHWQHRTPLLRVRTAVYADDLEAIPGPTGTPIGSSGLVEMGPLKVILDGSLGSRSAYCRHSYLDADGHPGYGTLALPLPELAALLEQARGRGLVAAVHAIGDAAVALAVEAIAAVGISASIEHAQMLTAEDIAMMARAGVTASVQPLHLLDDRDATRDLWPEQENQAYRFHDLLRAAVPLAFGSDAPVTPIDPWAAMAAAVHRSSDERSSWLPTQALQPRQALAASTDGVFTPTVGGRADLVLLEEDVFAPVPTQRDDVTGQELLDDAAAREAAQRLRAVRPLATMVAGQLTTHR